MTDKFTVEAAVDGKLQLSDLRMDPATLEHQAAVALVALERELCEPGQPPLTVKATRT